MGDDAELESQFQAAYGKETGNSFQGSSTGFFNHGFFQICLEQEAKVSERYSSTFTLALADINSFSAFNKRYGHLRGGRNLRDIASIIQDSIPTGRFSS